MSTPDDIANQLRRLGIHRGNLENYLSQQAMLGAAFVSPMILNGIREERENIQRIKGILRGWKVEVADLPNDSEAVEPATPVLMTSKDSEAMVSTAANQATPTPTSAAPRTQADPAADSKLRLPASAHSTASGDASTPYDLFISYHPADKAWVRGELMPRLEEAGLKVMINFRDFEIGTPRLVNVEQAVDRSRHTLIVLTQDWVDSEWENFQSLLTGTSDPAGRQRKLMPLVLKPCKPPRWIDYLTPVDLTLLEERDEQLQRLIRNLLSQAQPKKPKRTASLPRHSAKSQLSQKRSDLYESTEEATPMALSNTWTSSVFAKDTTDEGAIDFLIGAPLEEEHRAVLDKVDCKRVKPTASDTNTYYAGELPVTFPNGTSSVYRIVVTLLGKGRVPSALATQKAITRWRPHNVIVVGIAGGVASNGVSLGDVLVADQIVDYAEQKAERRSNEVRYKAYPIHSHLVNFARTFNDGSWMRSITTERPDAGTTRRHIGPVASGDTVIAYRKVLDAHKDVWTQMIGTEMEAGGAAAATFHEVDSARFFMVRGVSDLADGRKNSARVKVWRSYACDVAASYTIALLQSGPIASMTDKQLGGKSTPAASAIIDRRRDHLAYLEEQLKAAYDALEWAPEFDKPGIKKKIERIEREIAENQSKLR
jgi:nucleoside phosphorylase